MKNKSLIALILLLSFAVGCEIPNNNGGAQNNNQNGNLGDTGPSFVRIEDKVASLSFITAEGVPYPFDEFFCLEIGANHKAVGTQMWELSEKLSSELRTQHSSYRAICCINQNTKEFHIYADKVLWGVAAGEPLEEYLIFANNDYDFPITYPEGKIDFTRDLFKNRYCDIKDILQEDYMIPYCLTFGFKQLPPEKYDEITFTIYLRTGDNTEFSESATIDFITQSAP